MKFNPETGELIPETQTLSQPKNEGHYHLAKKHTEYATTISSILAGLMLFYIFSNYTFSGWAIFGFVISAIFIFVGVIGEIEHDKFEARRGMIIGGIILLITNWTIFALLSTVMISFYTSKFIFNKSPFSNKLIVTIPVVSFILFLILFFSTDNLNSSSYKNSNTQQNTYQPTIPINKNAYIKIDPVGNVRNGTSTETDIITSLNRGERVYLIEQDNATGWYKIRYGNNNYGYVSYSIISFDFIPKNSNNLNTQKNTY